MILSKNELRIENLKTEEFEIIKFEDHLGIQNSVWYKGIIYGFKANSVIRINQIGNVDTLNTFPIH